MKLKSIGHDTTRGIRGDSIKLKDPNQLVEVVFWKYLDNFP
jgi:hypothetical protein